MKHFEQRIHLEQVLILVQDKLKRDQKIYFLIDLYETLVHNTSDLKLASDKKFFIKFSQDETFYVDVSVRADFQHMLELLEPKIEIIVLTASYGQYAERILEFIDPNRIISHIFQEKTVTLMIKENMLKIYQSSRIANQSFSC